MVIWRNLATLPPCISETVRELTPKFLPEIYGIITYNLSHFPKKSIISEFSRKVNMALSLLKMPRLLGVFSGGEIKEGVKCTPAGSEIDSAPGVLPLRHSERFTLLYRVIRLLHHPSQDGRAVKGDIFSVAQMRGRSQRPLVNF